MTTPITLLVCALGGEGGGVLTEWLVGTARLAGHPAQATSIPGVAQRTGATTYYVEVFPVPTAGLAGRRPVFSLSPVPGRLDALVSSELLETARQVGAGLVSPDRTLVLSSSSRTLTTTERMQLADGRIDEQQLLQLVQRFSRSHQVFDMAALARECGTVVSAVLLGAIAGSGLFPFERRVFEEAILGGKPVDAAGASARASLRGFARAFDLVAAHRQQAAFVERLLAPGQQQQQHSAPASDGAVRDLPEPVRGIAALGLARVREYQDHAYAQLYLQRLQAVLAAEREADPAGAQGFATTREAARWLALWMAFDDIVRVADLKSRASRSRRVLGEVKAGEHDLLRVYDHFKPGVPEFAALLPPSLANRLVRWDRRRVAAGREPWALPLKVGTHTVTGMLALRTLAAMKALRPHGSRFAFEQRMVQRWVDAIVQGTRRHWLLGHEIARCGRLVKGYGATNERGKENLLHVLEHLAPEPDAEAAAQAIARAREAALADDAGKALDAALVAHGAPPRPARAQPIRFVRKPRAPRETVDERRADKVL